MPAREGKQLLLARWGHSVAQQWWRSWTHSSFYVQLADTITHCEQRFSLTSSKNYSFSHKTEYMGKISARLLAPAKYNSLVLRGTLATTVLGAHLHLFKPMVMLPRSTQYCRMSCNVGCKMVLLLHILFSSRHLTSQLLFVWIWTSPVKGSAEPKHPQLCNHGGGWSSSDTVTFISSGLAAFFHPWNQNSVNGGTGTCFCFSTRKLVAVHWRSVHHVESGTGLSS